MIEWSGDGRNGSRTAEVNAQAVGSVHAAEDRAADILGAAKAEADRVVERAREAAAVVFQRGEERLLAAVSAFVEGSTILRAELTRIEEEATGWRDSNGAVALADPAVSPPPPPGDTVAAPAADNGRPTARPAVGDLPRGTHDRAAPNGFHSPYPATPVDRPGGGRGVPTAGAFSHVLPATPSDRPGGGHPSKRAPFLPPLPSANGHHDRAVEHRDRA